MGEAHHTAFQKYLLARVQGQDATVRESLSQLDFSGRIKLNEKFAALKAIEKIFQNLPQLESDPRESIIKETEFLNKDKFAGCQIIRKLGQGGMGVVYLAYQEKLQREVVIKILHPFAAESETLRQRFIREGHIIGHLDHENIVPVYDVGDEDGTYYIIMKYIEGVPLSHVIDKLSDMDRGDIRLDSITSIIRDTAKNAHISKDELHGKSATEYFCNLMIKVADAVQYAHDQGVVHRDIKPANIIITPSGNPILVDFGLGHDEIQQSLTLSGEFLGTPIYSAPELFQKGKIENTQLLDVYSLGVTLYELLTGGVPYEGESVYEIFSNIKNKEPTRPRALWKGIPRDLEIIILKSISKDIHYRYQAALDISRDLRNFISYLPIEAAPPSLLQRTKYLAKRKKRSLLIGALSVVLLSTGLLIARDIVNKGATRINRLYLSRSLTESAAIDAVSGRIDQAIKKMEEAIETTPELRQTLVATLIGYKVQRDENYNASLEELEQLDPQDRNIDAMYLKMKIYSITERYDDAVHIAMRILEREPTYKVYRMLPAILWKGKKIGMALKYANDGLSKWPGDSDLNFFKAFLCDFELDDFKCANTHYSKAASNNNEYLNKYGFFLYKRSRYGDAVTVLEQAAKYKPDDPLIFEILGETYLALRECQKAINSIEKAKTIDSSKESITMRYKKIHDKCK